MCQIGKRAQLGCLILGEDLVMEHFLNETPDSLINMIMMCQCRFLNGNKCTSLMSEAENEKGYACVRAGSMWEISALSSKLWYEPKLL